MVVEEAEWGSCAEGVDTYGEVGNGEGEADYKSDRKRRGSGAGHSGCLSLHFVAFEVPRCFVYSQEGERSAKTLYAEYQANLFTCIDGYND